MTKSTHPSRSLRTRAVLVAVSALPAAAYAADSSWAVNATGNFSDPLNWSAGVPGAASGTTSTDVATFPRSIITANRTATIDTARNLGGITFDNTGAIASAIFNVSGATVGAATPAITLSANANVLNIGTGTPVGGANTLDAALVLSGNVTFSNTYGNSVLNVGNTAGTSLNSILASPGLGNIDVVLTGNSTGSSLFSQRINQGANTTVRMVKEGTGFWQINGPSATAGNMTGGLLIRQGGVSLGRNGAIPFGSGAIVIGDGTTTAGDIRVSLGSSVSVPGAVTVAASNATNVIFERGGGSGAGSFAGNFTLNRDIILRQGTTATQALNLSAANNVTGTGNIVVNTTVASAGTVNLQGPVNMTGSVINQSTVGTGLVTVSGLLGSNVVSVNQSSATSAMSLTNANNVYGNTNVTAGTLTVGASSRLGVGNTFVSSGATLTLNNSASFNDASVLVINSGALVNLNFAGTDTLLTVALGSLTGSYIGAGTYTASELNTFFGIGSVFAGTGSLNVIPEPSTVAALLGVASLAFVAIRRRQTRR
jgi:hypothetical protein